MKWEQLKPEGLLTDMLKEPSRKTNKTRTRVNKYAVPEIFVLNIGGSREEDIYIWSLFKFKAIKHSYQREENVFASLPTVT